MYSASRTTSPLARGTTDAQLAAAMAPAPMVQPAFRSPRRVTITLPFSTFEDLQSRADGEGRSLSNLAAFLLESALKGSETAPVVAAAPGTLRRSQENPFR
jgi:hypothetical protein